MVIANRGGNSENPFCRPAGIEPKLFDAFLKEFPIPHGQNLHPFLVLFDAYIGMGKSTVAKALAPLIDAVIVNNDAVRDFLHEPRDVTNRKDILQEFRIKALLANHNNCICDSNLCTHNYRKLHLYESLGCKYYIVRLECPEEVVCERLEKRHAGAQNFYSHATYADHLAMKAAVALLPADRIDFAIATDRDLFPQVQALANWIQQREQVEAQNG